jgi:hypothetical protein
MAAQGKIPWRRSDALDESTLREVNILLVITTRTSGLMWIIGQR